MPLSSGVPAALLSSYALPLPLVPCSILPQVVSEIRRIGGQDICAYPRYDLLYPLLMTLHHQEGLDLTQRYILPISERDELVECAKQLKRMPQNLSLIQALADTRNNLSKKMQGVDILKNVGLAVGNEDHVQLVEGLIDESDVVLLNSRMLRTSGSELWKGSKKGFYP